MNRYYKNIKNNNTNKLITNQFTSKFSNLKFAKTNVRAQGCGIVAIHNILCLLGKEKYFSTLVAEFDYNMITSGKNGIFIGTLDSCLDSYVKSKYCEGKNNIGKNIKNRKYGIIRVAWDGGGGHFIALKFEANMYMAYNVKKGRKTATASDLNNLESKIKGTIGMGLAIKK